MFCRCCQCVLIVVGVALLLAAVLPFVPLLRIPEPYATGWISAKLLMLPVGAICLGLAAALSEKLKRR